MPELKGKADGKLINENQLFVEMKDMVGWDDEKYNARIKRKG